MLWYRFKEKPRQLMGCSLGCHYVGAANPTPDISHQPSAAMGCVKRVAAKMPEINRALLRKLKRFTDRFMRKWFPHDQFSCDEEFDFYEWIEQTRYPQYRKMELIEVYKKLIAKGYSNNQAFCKSFIKFESYTEFKHFRGIYSRTDEYKVQVGPMFTKISERVFNKNWFIKKIPVDKRAEWLYEKFRNMNNIYCTDFSSFEAMFVAPLMRAVEFRIYNYFLKHNKYHDFFMKRLDVMYKLNKIMFREFMIEIKAKRMSGEMNTSLGNGLTNLILSHFIIENKGGTIYESAFEGDDGIISASFLPTSEDYKLLGASIKIEIPNSLSEASFCGQVFAEEAKDVVCDPLEVLASFGFCGQRYAKSKRSVLDKLLCAKSLSYLYQYPGCPIIKSLAVMGLRLTKHIDWNDALMMHYNSCVNTWERDQAKILHNEVNRRKNDMWELINKPIHFSTRILVQNKYNILIQQQYKFEEYINAINHLQPLEFPEFLMLYNKDQRKYYDDYCVECVDRRDVSFKIPSLARSKIYITAEQYILY